MTNLRVEGGAMIKLIFALLLLSACTTSYKHMDATPLHRGSNDAYDLVCAGIEVDKRLRISGNYCHNVAPHGGEFLLIDVTYRWKQ
jgi:hypothetical protein